MCISVKGSEDENVRVKINEEGREYVKAEA